MRRKLPCPFRRPLSTTIGPRNIQSHQPLSISAARKIFHSRTTKAASTSSTRRISSMTTSTRQLRSASRTTGRLRRQQVYACGNRRTSLRAIKSATSTSTILTLECITCRQCRRRHSRKYSPGTPNSKSQLSGIFAPREKRTSTGERARPSRHTPTDTRRRNLNAARRACRIKKTSGLQRWRSRNCGRMCARKLSNERAV